MTRDPDEHLARALAWGCLDAPEWTQRGLVAAGAETLGHRYGWMRQVVRPVAAAYHRAPVDRPHELARFLLASTTLLTHTGRARQRGTPVRVRTIALGAAGPGPRRWPVPPVHDLASLAGLLELPLEQLTWAADTKGLQRRTPPGPLHLYRYQWVSRPGAVPRLLEAPTPLLRAVLRRTLEGVLRWVPVDPAAHGFVRGRSALTNAAAHVGAQTLVCLDLQTFFATITVARVKGLFRSMGYPETVAWTLACLCTHQKPVAVLSRMPAGGDSSDRHRLRARLRARHLAQGAPTSPALANLACVTLDRRLTGYAAAAGLTYTRYADDLAFSGREVESARLIRVAGTIAREEGFMINTSKTRVRNAHQRQEVTGLVTNERLGVPRDYHDQLRAVLHDARLHGVVVANRSGHTHFRAHLDGRVGWVESVNPVRGRRLRADFEAIAWPDR
ncbi:reverse transcriptase family protein [Dermatophilaceae bacterium Soc4.6]